MSVQNSLLLQCYEHAAAVCTQALGRCIEQAVASLQEAETKAARGGGREELGEAWRELNAARVVLCKDYGIELLQALKRADAKALRDEPAGEVGAQALRSQALSLSLADDTELSLVIEGAKLLEGIMPVVDQRLSDLNALISSAQGLASVSPERNPLRPKVFTRSLRAVLLSARLEQPVVTLALRHLAGPLAQELKALYADLAGILTGANVKAAEYRVLLTPGGAGETAAAGTGPEEAAKRATKAAAESSSPNPAELPPEHYANPSTHANGTAALRDFLARADNPSPQRLSGQYYAAVERELEQLRGIDEPLAEEPSPPDPAYRAAPPPERPARLVNALSQLSSKIWGAYGRAKERALLRGGLKKQATRVDQALGLEVVRQVVEHVARDPRLLAPVREAIVALEPSLLRLALVDPRFLTEASHPGRRLIEGVAQRSLNHNDEFSAEFERFFQPVARAFNQLNGMEAVHASAFEQALDSLSRQWTSDDAAERERSKDVLQTLSAAEQRQTLADQIAQELGLRSDVAGAPKVALDFLYGPWALVMAHARMTATRPEPDPGGFGAVVTDLLWSVKLDLTLKEPARLLAMIPGMLSRLRAGLHLLGHSQHESDAFFEELMRLHQPVLERRLRKPGLPTDVPASAATPPAPAVERRQPRISELPWLGPQERRAAGFEEPPPAASNGAQGPAAAPAVADAAKILPGLVKGSWVDLLHQDTWLRAELVWTNAKRNMFMFVSQGHAPHSMTGRSCERLIANGHLRPVNRAEVVTQALQALQGA